MAMVVCCADTKNAVALALFARHTKAPVVGPVFGVCGVGGWGGGGLRENGMGCSVGWAVGSHAGILDVACGGIHEDEEGCCTKKI